MTFDFAALALKMGIGFGVGVLSGLMGIGGGALLVPAAVFILAVDQHVAQGVSLAVIVPTAIAGALTHHRQGFVVPRVALLVGLVSVAFAFAAAQVAGMLDGVWLGRAFGALIIFVGMKMIVRK